MPLQTINLGTYANDGTGDDLRVAFTKVNANFALLNSVGGINNGVNLGTGTAIFKQKDVANLEFKTLTSSDSTVLIDGSNANTVDLKSRSKVQSDTTPVLGGNLNLNNLNLLGSSYKAGSTRYYGDVKSTVFGYDNRITENLVSLLVSNNNFNIDLGTFTAPARKNPAGPAYSWDFGSDFTPSNNNINLGFFGGSGSIEDRADNKITLSGNLTTVGGHNLIFNLPTDATVTVPNGGTLATTGFHLGQFAQTTSAQLLNAITDATGTNKLVYSTSPTLASPIITGGFTFGGITSTGTTGTGSLVFSNNPTFTSAEVNGTLNLFGASVTATTGTGKVVLDTSPTFASDVIITGNLTVNGTTTTVSSTTVNVADKNIELGSVVSPTNTTANGGGVTLKGATDKTFSWLSSTSAWTSSEHIDLASAKAYYIAGSSVLNATTLGTGVTASSLTSVGTLTSLSVSGSITVGSVTSTGVTGTGKFVFDNAPTITGHPTIEGVTATGATGTGNIVYSASPTITGNVTIQGVTSTGATGTGKFVFDNAPTITGNVTVQGVTSTGATGTGKFVFDASPTITGHPTIEGVTATGATGTGNIVFSTGPTFNGFGVIGTAGFGYSTGGGGTATQTVSRTSGVSVSKTSGAITLVASTTTANQVSTFTVTNTLVAATDVVIVSMKSGNGIYFPAVTATAAGSFAISVFTPTAVGSAESPVINFAIIKAVTA